MSFSEKRREECTHSNALVRNAGFSFPTRRARSTDNRSPTIWGVQGYLSPKRQNGTVASSIRLNACFAYLVGVDAVDKVTDFGPIALRLTGAAQALVEVSASAYFLVQPLRLL